MASGITVAAEVNEAIGEVSKKKCGIVILGLNEALTEVVVQDRLPYQQTGETVVELLRSTLSKGEPKYCVVSFPYKNNEDQTREKIILISWVPDESNVKQRMIFASSYNTVRNSCQGVQKTYQASDFGDLDFTAIRKKCDGK